GMVAAATVGLVLTVVVLTVMLVLLWRGKEDTTKERKAAGIAEKRGSEEATKAKQAEQTTDAKAKVADTNTKEAKEQLDRILDNTNKLAFEVQAKLEDEPVPTESMDGAALQLATETQKARRKLREELLATAVAGLEGVAKRAEKTPGTDYSTAVARQRMGDVFLLADEIDKARDQYEKSRTITEALLKTDPRNVPARQLLALTYNKLGKAYLIRNPLQHPRIQREPAKAQEYAGKAVEVFEQL